MDRGSEKSEMERDLFWDTLEGCVNSFEDDVNVMVLGDLNARVGNTVIDGVVARFGVPDVNDSGVRLIEMCINQELAVGNTFFKKRKKKKYTWARVVRGRVVERVLMYYIVVSRKRISR